MTKAVLTRVVFWTLFAAAAIVAVWWTVHIDYRPGAVLELVPLQAEWVSLHEKPAGRWPEWSRNGAVRAATAAAGLDLEALGKELETPDGKAWFRRLGGREAAIAFVPALPYSGEPAWIISCWAGGYSQRLRWLMAVSGARPAPGPYGDASHPIWLMKAEGLPDGMRLAMGIREGVVVFAVSTDALSAMRLCLGKADGSRYRPPVPGPETGCPDRAWLRGPEPVGQWQVKIEELTAARLRATAWREEPWPAGLAGPAAGNPAALAGLLGKAEGSVTAPWTYCRNWLLPRAGDWIGPVDALVKEAAGTEQARVALAVYGGEHAARIRSLFGGGIESFIAGLKVPAFLVAIPVPDEAAAQAAAGRFLDRFNRIKPYGLVPRPAGVCYGYTVTAVEGTRGAFYKDLAPSEQAAYAVAGGWLVAGSHLGSLEGLLPSVPHGPVAAGPGAGGATLRLEAPVFGQTVGKFMAALSLVYMAADTPEADRNRARLAEWRGWLERLAPLGQVEVTARPGSGGAEIVITADSVMR
jgi:hypothetical protein